ncbi:MAG: hypothetical protein JNJ57_09240 [Saprospiraceae bacterium]|nr:hypothetical protein [Saprospiraceae bacterium]
MKTLLTTLVLLLTVSPLVKAQNDSLPQPKPLLLEEKINLTRLELKSSFMAEDPVAVGLWLDSLARLEDEVYVGVSWDERWLLYFWMENFGTLLSEAGEFGQEARDIQSFKVPPPADSLFELIDGFMLERRFEVFQQIRHAFLNDQEKAFATMLLEYLLRLNTNEDDWYARIEAFETKYPTSKFLPFLRSVKPSILKPANKAFGISGGFLSGSWSKELDRSVRPLFAFNIEAYYWVDRWNLQLGGIFGAPRIARDVSDGLETWPKNDPTNFTRLSLELGYDVINNSKLRIFPAFVGAITYFGPPTPDEDSDEEIPEYYDNFELFEAHLGVSLTADTKLFKQNYSSWGLPKGSYHGLRVRLGYNWLNFGKDTPDLRGNLFYFAIGYNLFGYLEAKK